MAKSYMAQAQPQLQMRGRSAKPPGSRTENMAKKKLGQDFGKMSVMAGSVNPKVPKGPKKLK